MRLPVRFRGASLATSRSRTRAWLDDQHHRIEGVEILLRHAPDVVAGHSEIAVQLRVDLSETAVERVIVVQLFGDAQSRLPAANEVGVDEFLALVSSSAVTPRARIESICATSNVSSRFTSTPWLAIPRTAVTPGPRRVPTVSACVARAALSRRTIVTLSRELSPWPRMTFSSSRAGVSASACSGMRYSRSTAGRLACWSVTSRRTVAVPGFH